MKHSFLDKYSDGTSLIHKLDPRTKFITAFVIILAVVLSPPGSWVSFAAYLIIISVLVILSSIPTLFVLKRSMIILPFVLLLAVSLPFYGGEDILLTWNIFGWHLNITYSGLNIILNVLIKAWLSALTLIWLTSTTSVTLLLHGLERMRFPRIIILLLSFMYRYIFVLVDEVMRMRQAMDSRTCRMKRWQIWRTTGHMIGTLFVRSYERGERVYAAMTARGFDGQIRTLNNISFQVADTRFAFICGLFLLCVVTFTVIN